MRPRQPPHSGRDDAADELPVVLAFSAIQTRVGDPFSAVAPTTFTAKLFTKRGAMMSVEATALSRSKLEQKDRAELAAIVEAMGGKAGSRAKKADLVDQVLHLAGAGDSPRRDNPSPDDQKPDDPNPGAPAEPRAAAPAADEPPA